MDTGKRGLIKGNIVLEDLRVLKSGCEKIERGKMARATLGFLYWVSVDKAL